MSLRQAGRQAGRQERTARPVRNQREGSGQPPRSDPRPRRDFRGEGRAPRGGPSPQTLGGGGDGGPAAGSGEPGDASPRDGKEERGVHVQGTSSPPHTPASGAPEPPGPRRLLTHPSRQHQVRAPLPGPRRPRRLSKDLPLPIAPGPAPSRAPSTWTPSAAAAHCRWLAPVVGQGMASVLTLKSGQARARGVPTSLPASLEKTQQYHCLCDGGVEWGGRVRIHGWGFFSPFLCAYPSIKHTWFPWTKLSLLRATPPPGSSHLSPGASVLPCLGLGTYSGRNRTLRRGIL